MFIIKTLKKKHVFNKRKVSLVSPTWDNRCWHPRTVLLILWSMYRFLKTHIPEPHLQRSGVAESGVESESHHPSQHPGSADTLSSGAHTVRISVLNMHYPHMTVWYSPVSQKPLSCPQVPFFSITWKGCEAWHATGVATLEFQGLLTWRLQTPKGFTERSTPLVVQCIFFFFLHLKYGLEESTLSKWPYYPKQSTDSMQSLSSYQWYFSQN